MDFVFVAALFTIFGIGVVLVFQGIVGGEFRYEDAMIGRRFDRPPPSISHPRERHPWRLVLIGLTLMASSIALGLIFL